MLLCLSTAQAAVNSVLTQPENFSIQVPNKQEKATLRYYPEKDFSRFILEFAKLPQYKLKSGNGKTLLIFNAPFKIETTNFTTIGAP